MKKQLLFGLDFVANTFAVLAMAIVPALVGYAAPLDRCALGQSCFPQQLLSAMAGFCLTAVMILSMVIIPACYFGFSFVSGRNRFSDEQNRARFIFWMLINAALAFIYLCSSSWLQAFWKAAATNS